jgi:PRC-barrel domain
MTLPTIDQARAWRGLTLLGIDDEPVGKIETIYVDRSSRQPEWALVNTGLFGSSRTFVPLAGAAQRGEIVQVPHQTSVVRAAPRLGLDAKFSEADEARLYAHYGIAYTTQESASGGGAPAANATSELPPSSRLQADVPAAAGGLSAAGGSARAARTATRTAVQAGQQAATSGRLAVHKARQEVAAGRH